MLTMLTYRARVRVRGGAIHRSISAAMGQAVRPARYSHMFLRGTTLDAASGLHKGVLLDCFLFGEPSYLYYMSTPEEAAYLRAEHEPPR